MKRYFTSKSYHSGYVRLFVLLDLHCIRLWTCFKVICVFIGCFELAYYYSPAYCTYPYLCLCCSIPIQSVPTVPLFIWKECLWAISPIAQAIVRAFPCLAWGLLFTIDFSRYEAICGWFQRSGHWPRKADLTNWRLRLTSQAWLCRPPYQPGCSSTKKTSFDRSLSRRLVPIFMCIEFSWFTLGGLSSYLPSRARLLTTWLSCYWSNLATSQPGWAHGASRPTPRSTAHTRKLVSGWSDPSTLGSWAVSTACSWSAP